MIIKFLLTTLPTVHDGISAAEYSDVIVCQGEEAGGHGQSGLSTWTLLLLLQEKLRELGKTVPLVTAGGIGDENGLIKALDMGASGIIMGTRFLASVESSLPDEDKLRIIKATKEDTVRCRVFDLLCPPPWPEPVNGKSKKIKRFIFSQIILITGRALKDKWSMPWINNEDELSQPNVNKREVKKFNEGNQSLSIVLAVYVYFCIFSRLTAEGGYSLWCGTGVNFVVKTENAKDIVHRIATNAIQLLEAKAK
ncbi:unnamed protein product [Didymodactylos carnosus]|uniref:Nitronate monooxygenase domain-containing protein n=1 Tax=Didymodactylos carnosus TaxID=1234261 RepID=A0A8S2DIT5_9BILA|nr:unnamed protein product [Didymodactylos carnosus]CAF3723898.1 unnamed protein product [Didymodactylos carnosus]